MTRHPPGQRPGDGLADRGVVFDDKNRERCRRFPVGWAQDRLRRPDSQLPYCTPACIKRAWRECVALRPLLLKTSLVLHARSIAYFAPVPSIP